ncbi:MAG: putative lipid II flippase FtsW [bacterium]|nr:putative lipid II flippase FtsW [bacterium]
MSRSFRKGTDLPLLAVTLLLVVCGLAMILSASAAVGELSKGDGLTFVKKQALFAGLGIAVMAFTSVFPLEHWRAWSRPTMMLSGLMLLALHVPGVGVTIYGSTRWLKLGPVVWQPSEVAKLALILFVADVLARYPRDRWTFRDYRDVLLPVACALLLILVQPDLGTTLAATLSVFLMFWCNGTSVARMGSFAACGAAGVLMLPVVMPYQRDRWTALLDPWSDPKGIGFQIIQSLLAIGSGGIFGLGYGQGKQKLFYLPIQYADFIFAVIAEELGLMGSLGLVLLFAIFGYRGLVIARNSMNPFHQLLAIGVTTLIVGQAFTNIGVVTACLPTTGIPLPFVSHGGTSLLITMFSVGVLLNISRRNNLALRLAGSPEQEA